jgi:hypothetical protein
MTRNPCAAILLVWMCAGCTLGAKAQAPPADASKPIIFLLPDGFRGWACTDFGVAGAPPLPREGDALIIRPGPGGVLATSDQARESDEWATAWYEVNGQRWPLPKDVYLRRQAGGSDGKKPVGRHCAFFGTEDDSDAAEDPPGYPAFPRPAQGVSREERQALVALYEATDGSHWTHRVGWLGPPGTECKWHGVVCGSSSGGPPVVTALDLSENNLVGAVPAAVGQLTHLEDLLLFGNRLSGRLPEPSIRRWLSGPLWISADAPILTDVSEIDFESWATSLLCERHRIELRSDGRAVLFTKRCRNATPGDRITFCEVKAGRVWPDEFARLGWLLEKNGFFGLTGEYNRNVSDSGFENTRVTRDGKVHAVRNYAGAAPVELWVVQRAIEGVAQSVEWEKTTTQPECPLW